MHAEIKTYEGVGDYIQTEDDPPKSIKEKAKLYAERNALEQAGVFISSYSKTKNFELVDDEIISITGSILKIIDTTFEIIPLNDKTGVTKYRAKVLAEIDTDKIEAAFDKWLGRDKKERSALAKQNEELKRIIDEQNKRIAALEQTVRNAKTDADNQKIREEIKIIDKDTLYAQKLDKAQKLIETQKYENAVKIYTEAVDMKPDSPEAYKNRGLAYEWLDRNEQAIQDYTKVIELNPNLVEAYTSCAWVYLLIGESNATAKDLLKALEINPNYEDIYVTLIQVEMLGLESSFLDVYSKAIELAPKEPRYYTSRAYVYKEMQNYDAAIKDYTEMIKRDPKNENAYWYRDWFYEELEKYDETIADYTKVIELDPKNSSAYLNRGVAYARLKNYEQAIKDYTKAIELNPKDGLAYNNRGLCYQRIGDEAKAQADFAKAKELGSKS